MRKHRCQPVEMLKSKGAQESDKKQEYHATKKFTQRSQIPSDESLQRTNKTSILQYGATYVAAFPPCNTFTLGKQRGNDTR